MWSLIKKLFMPTVALGIDCDCACATPPDFSATAAATEEAARYGYQAASEDLAFRRQVYEDSKPRQMELEDLAKQIAQQQLDIGNENQGNARQQFKSYLDTFAPVERQTALDSFGIRYLGDEDRQELISIISGETDLTDTEKAAALERLSKQADEGAAYEAETKARADVNSAYGQQSRALQRLGIDPNRIAAVSANLGSVEALNQVNAANNARLAVRGQGVGLRTGVANFGRNQPNTAGQAFGLAIQSGNSAVANQSQGFGAGLPYAQFAAGATANQLGAAGLAQQGALGYGQLLNTAYGIDQDGYGNLGNDGGANGVLGAGIGAVAAVI